MYRNHLSPPLFLAAWACDFGEDQFGLWMAFTTQGVRLCLRWIAPGAFRMGSPDDENGRWQDEVLHAVTISQGFWLAETTVTQALWQAVTGKNPSRFKGENRPVETISWHEAQDFIQQLNLSLQALQPEYRFRLPTEAEWEYARQAGSEMPFNFGGELTLETVNYRGTWDDYSQWGQGALQETAEVKSYPCNPWGLFEMHGNVWEWCQDYWTEQLTKEPAIDPTGPKTGAERVVRGGSWFSSGRYVRSACRNRDVAGNRHDYLGLRLALGLELRPG